MNPLPIQCLELFDLSHYRERRLATYALEDYYATVLSEAGEEYLGFTPEDTGRGVGVQWNEAKRRLQSISSTRIPEKYNDIIHRLGNERDPVAHGYQYRPQKRRLVEARETAEEWADWFLNQAKEYREQEGELSAREILYSMIRNSLESALFDPEIYERTEFQDKQREINSRIFSIVYYNLAITFDEVDLNEIFTEEVGEYGYRRLVKTGETFPSKIRLDRVHDGVDENDLLKSDLFLYQRSLNLQNEVAELRKKAEALEYQDTMAVSNTTRCIVVEPVDQDTGEIHLLVSHSEGQDEHIWQDIGELPDQLQQELKNKEEHDTVDAVLGVNRFGEWYIKDLLGISD